MDAPAFAGRFSHALLPLAGSACFSSKTRRRSVPRTRGRFCGRPLNPVSVPPVSLRVHLPSLAVPSSTTTVSQPIASPAVLIRKVSLLFAAETRKRGRQSERKVLHLPGVAVRPAFTGQNTTHNPFVRGRGPPPDGCPCAARPLPCELSLVALPGCTMPERIAPASESPWPFSSSPVPFSRFQHVSLQSLCVFLTVCPPLRFSTSPLLHFASRDSDPLARLRFALVKDPLFLFLFWT